MPIYFVNADDKNKRAIATKQKILAPFGIKQLAPGYNNFTARQLPLLLGNAVSDGSAENTMIILDTAKKFVDLLDSKAVVQFNQSVEMFAAKGGTLIATGHVNKNKDENGNVVYKGTSDILDDWHCVWLGTPLVEENGLRRTSFLNLKARGDVPESVTFEYRRLLDDYEAMFETVKRVPASEEEESDIRARLIRETEFHCVVVDAIREAINAGTTSKTALLQQVREVTGESRSHVDAVLTQFTGTSEMDGLWRVLRGKHNTHTFKLT